MEEYLSKVPENIRIIILDLASSDGFNKNDYSSIELLGFIQGAIAMYFNQQKLINKLKVDIDLLESELPWKKS